MLNGVDLASPYQTGFPNLGQDFVIVKFTEGTYYSNPDREAQIATATLKAAYHFAAGMDVRAEADYFLQVFKPYIGQAIPILDYEAAALKKWTPKDVELWLSYVYQKTGTRPWLYMSLATENNQNWEQVSNQYPLWVAQYNVGLTKGFQPRPLYGKLVHKWNLAAFQYAGGNGRLAGWGNGTKAVDLDVCYWTKLQWKSWICSRPDKDISLHPVVKWNVKRVFVVTESTGCDLYDSLDLTKVIGHLDCGTSFAVLEEQAGALKLGKKQWADGRMGYTKSNPLATQANLPGQVKIVLDNSFAVLSPTATGSKAGKLVTNELYDVVGRVNNYFELENKYEGKKVYVSSDNAYVVL